MTFILYAFRRMWKNVGIYYTDGKTLQAGNCNGRRACLFPDELRSAPSQHYCSFRDI